MSDLLKAVHGGLHRLGLDVVPYSGRYFPGKLKVETMQRLGVAAVIDVGANTGQYAREIRRAGWRGRIVSFEPLPNAFLDLLANQRGDASWEVRNYALGAARGQAAINISRNSWSSSFLPIAELHIDSAPDASYVGTADVPVERLDDQIGDESGPLYVKVDTQGYELEVLKGAEESLRRTVAVELELSLGRLYEGSPLAADVIRYMADSGFVPIGIEHGFHASDGALLQMNVIFVHQLP